MRAFVLRLSLAAASTLAISACQTDDAKPPPTASGTIDGDGASDGTSTGTASGPQSPDGPASSQQYVELTKETMDFAGRTRRYLLAKPKDYDAAKSYPLVLSFHGNPGTAEAQAKGLPFDSVSKTEAVIAYPQALDGNWDLYTPTADNADMNWVRALVDAIATKANVDKANVLGFGYSGGAFFITQVACRFGGFFKAISVNAGGGPDEPNMGYAKHPNGCYVCPGGPIPAIVTHGAADGEVEPSSGGFTASCFATTNGCEVTRSAAEPAPCQQHDGCPADKPVKWCLVPGLGHGVWDSAMKGAWAFFKGV